MHLGNWVYFFILMCYTYKMEHKDIISLQVTCKFYYKECETEIEIYDDIVRITIIGFNDGKFVTGSQTFNKQCKHHSSLIVELGLELIEIVYEDLMNEEYDLHTQN